ncbi:MAG: hypothetical protein KUG81_08865 [Gammaproteobacteria bacterium]|nr:hypothetical protein [Gammaproteobacteria bacterium]
MMGAGVVNKRSPLRWVRKFSVGIALLAVSTASFATVSLLPDWQISGSNTLRGGHYSATSDASSGPYPFEGDLYFNEFNVYLNKQNSRYDSFRGEISGVYNLNDNYRAARFGVVPERLSLVRENGGSALPYRLELGDHFAYYSYLTLQRSLKGAQVEFQPASKIAGRRHSIQITSGANDSSWRGLSLQEDHSTGASWLMQDEKLGSVSINFVHNSRDSSTASGTADRSQNVLSIAGERQLAVGDHSLTVEAEAAHFSGDHNGLTGAASGQDKADNGYFLQLSGRSNSLPWDYQLRFDRYGQDFQPRGAVVTADRRSMELRSGWMHSSGVRIRGRLQHFEDGFETINETRTRTYGANLSGPLLRSIAPDLNGNLDAFIQNIDNQTGTTDTLTHNLNMSVTKPLVNDWTGRATLFLQNLKDDGLVNADLFTRQIRVNADHSIEIGGFTGIITPGFEVRYLRKGLSHSNDINPTLAVSLNRGPHTVRMDYSSRLQNRSFTTSGADIDTHTLNLDYHYTRRQHIFGLETNLFNREPTPGESTEAYRLSAYWTYSFDRPPVNLAGRNISSLGIGAPTSGPIEATIAGLAPGSGKQQVDAALLAAGIAGGVNQGGYQVFEYPLYRDLFRRQRLALQFEQGLLARSALVVDFDDVGDRNSVLQTFEQIRQMLIRELGSPTRTYEEGEFGPAFVADVNSQRLTRIVEWVVPTGVIRFGIPRRLDGQVRMEIQHAVRFSQSGETLWSVEGVR